MRSKDIDALAKLYTESVIKSFLYTESVTRTSEKEIGYYMDEVFGDNYSDLKFIPYTPESFSPPLDPMGHPKYDHIKFDFLYKGVIPVKVFSGPGQGAKDENGSLSVSMFYTVSNVKQRDTNSFYNGATRKVNYDPIITNGKDLLMYVKSVLDRDDRDKDEEPDIVSTPPNVKPSKKLVGV